MTAFRLVLILVAGLAVSACHGAYHRGHIPPGQAKKVIAPPPGQAKKMHWH